MVVTEDFRETEEVVTILLIVVKYDRFEKSRSDCGVNKRCLPRYCGANHFLLMLLHPFQQQWSVESHLQISSTFPATVLRVRPERVD